MKTVLYGSSDDLIQIAGPLGHESEMGKAGDVATVRFSDGTVAQMTYSPDYDPKYEGQWHITVLSRGALFEGWTRAEGADGSHYSDVLTLAAGVTHAWVRTGERGEYRVSPA